MSISPSSSSLGSSSSSSPSSTSSIFTSCDFVGFVDSVAEGMTVDVEVRIGAGGVSSSSASSSALLRSCSNFSSLSPGSVSVSTGHTGGDEDGPDRLGHDC